MLNIAYIALTIATGRGDVATHWSFDTLKNNTAVESLLGLNAEVHGAELQQGALHGALYFDGIADYVAIESIGMAQKTIGSMSEGTISTWFRFDHEPESMDIETIFYLGAQQEFSNFGTSANCYELEIGHFSSQRRLYWTNISTPEEVTEIPLCWSTTGHLQVGQWYHIVSSTSSNGTHIYLDDVEIFDPGDCTWQFGSETTRRFLGDVLQQEAVWFGKGLWNNEEQFFEGVIDEFKIWNRALTREEVTQEHERVASVIAISIDEQTPSEIILSGDLELSGDSDNMNELRWRVDSGDIVTVPYPTLDADWSLLVEHAVFSAGRHTVTVWARNAAGRVQSDSRMVIQSDMNADGIVDVNDLLVLIAAWGECDCIEDLTGDGMVSIADILLLLSAWG